MFRVPLRPQAVTRAHHGRRDGAWNGRGCRRAGPDDRPYPCEDRHRRDRSALHANGDRRAGRHCATHRARRATSFRERRRDGRRALQDERPRHDRGGWSDQSGKLPSRPERSERRARTVGALITPTPVRQPRLARGARTAGALGALELGIRFHALHLASAQQLDLAALLGTQRVLPAALPARGLGRAAVGNAPIRRAGTTGGAICSR